MREMILNQGVDIQTQLRADEVAMSGGTLMGYECWLVLNGEDAFRTKKEKERYRREQRITRRSGKIRNG